MGYNNAVGRIGTRQPTTDFGEWLLAEIERRGWERKTLAAKSDVGFTTVSQIIAGLRNPSRDMVTRLASALSSEDASERTARALLNAGLKAAGFAAEETIPIEYEPILDELRSASYDGGLDNRDVSEVVQIIRIKHRRKAERQEK
jgi:transcriptional regulator with XRE-family HTH domain